MSLLRVCGWCRKYMGWKPGGNGVTHGICTPCLKKLKQEMAAVKLKDRYDFDQEEKCGQPREE